MRIWDAERNGDVISKTFFDQETGRVVSTIEQDVNPIKEACIRKQNDFRGFDSEVSNQVASIPVNLHYFWMNTQNYDFTDFDKNPWVKTVQKIKDEDLSAFFTVPNGGVS